MEYLFRITEDDHMSLADMAQLWNGLVSEWYKDIPATYKPINKFSSRRIAINRLGGLVDEINKVIGKTNAEAKKPEKKLKEFAKTIQPVYKNNGKMSPVKTAFMIFDMYFKALSRKEYLELCNMTGIKKSTAARQWTVKMKEIEKELEMK